MDPFCGKGTVLLEASLLGRRTLGLDVAPDAAIVTNAKLNAPPIEDVERFLRTTRLRKPNLTRISNDIRTFFAPPTLEQILSLRDYLLTKLSNGTTPQRRTANFLLGTLLGILHGHSALSLSVPSSHSFGMAPRYVRKYARQHKLKRPYRDVKNCLLLRAKQILTDEPPSAAGRVICGTADRYPRTMSKRLENMVDLILTSPPYLDVQTYAKDSWLRLWLLGYDYKLIRQASIETGSPRLYLERMAPCLREMLRVLKPLGRAVIISGDAPYVVRNRKKFLRIAHVLGSLATKLSHLGYTFKLQDEFVDDIPAHARYYSAVHKDGKRGAARKGVQVERIIILTKVKSREL